MGVVFAMERARMLSLPPERFVSELRRAKHRWRREAPGRTGRDRKRYADQLGRTLAAQYRQRHGIAVLPTAARQIAAASVRHAPSEIDASNYKVVFAPLPENPGASGTLKGRRKALRRVFRVVEEVDRGRHFQLVASRHSNSASAGARPILVAASVGQHLERVSFLENVGAAICGNLSAEDVERLEAAGAVVLENKPITLDVPEPSDTGGAAGTSSLDFWHLDRIEVESARIRGLRGEGVLIGVLDTGIDPNHPEFAGKRVYFSAFDSVGVPLSTPAKDFEKHGTQVSSLCAGRTIGVAPAADLAVAAVLTYRDSVGRPVGYPAQILAGLNWLVQGGKGLPQEVDLVNASLGVPGIDATLERGFAEPRRTLNIVTIAAIGNNGRRGINNHGCPGNGEAVVGVGAVDRNDNIAPFSDWGTVPSAGTSAIPKPELVAPGVAVTVAVPKQRKSTSYSTADGTSFASPLVAGAAALLIERDPGLRNDADKLVALILSLTRKSPSSATANATLRFGAGCLDLSRL